MNEIRFDTGIREFNVNGAVKVRFCPSDMDFVEKVFGVIETLDKKTEAFKERIKDLKSNRDVFDEARAIDNEIRELINSIFDTDVCTPLFGTTNTFALADGLPLWANFLFAIADTLDSDLVEQKKRTNPRLKKYIDKYKRR